MTDRELVGVIVAAGGAERMGRPKQLLPIGDLPMLEVVIRAAEASTLDRVIVVTGVAHEAVRRSVAVGRAEWAHNPDPGRGSITSFRIGLAAGGRSAGAMLLAGDQPELSTEIINAVAGAWRQRRPWAARTRYRHSREAHPFVFSAEALARLEPEQGDKVLWRLMESHTDLVQVVEVDAPAPIDVNTWADYEAVCDRLGVEPAD